MFDVKVLVKMKESVYSLLFSLLNRPTALCSRPPHQLLQGYVTTIKCFIYLLFEIFWFQIRIQIFEKKKSFFRGLICHTNVPPLYFRLYLYLLGNYIVLIFYIVGFFFFSLISNNTKVLQTWNNSGSVPVQKLLRATFLKIF